eukprot:s2861_g3.t3
MVLLTLTAIAAGTAGAGVTWSRPWRCHASSFIKSFLSRALGSPCKVGNVDVKLSGGELHFEVSGVEVGNVAPYKSASLLRITSVIFVVNLKDLVTSGSRHIVIEEMALRGLQLTLEQKPMALDSVEEFLRRIARTTTEKDEKEGMFRIKKLRAQSIVVDSVVTSMFGEPETVSLSAPPIDITDFSEPHGAETADNMIRLLLKEIMGSASRVVSNYLLMAQTFVNLEEAPSYIWNAYAVMVYSLFYSINALYYESDLQAMSWVLLCFSAILPYVKLILMMVSWIMPSRFLPLRLRNFILVLMDDIGKFSLVDVFTVQFLSGVFHLEIAGTSPKPGSDPMRMVLRTNEELGFAAFVCATVVSLIIGHLCRHYHEKSVAYELSECSSADVELQSQVATFDHPLSGPSTSANSSRFSWQEVIVGPSLLAAFVLTVAGCSMTAFSVHLRCILGPLGQSHFSLFQFAYGIPSFSEHPLAWPTLFNQFTFILFAIGVNFLQLILLLLLWYWRVPKLKHIDWRAVAHCLGAWSALDVALISMIITMLELGASDFVHLWGSDKDRLTRRFGIDVRGPEKGLTVDVVLSTGTYLLFVAVLLQAWASRASLHFLDKRSLGFRLPTSMTSLFEVASHQPIAWAPVGKGPMPCSMGASDCWCSEACATQRCSKEQHFRPHLPAGLNSLFAAMQAEQAEQNADLAVAEGAVPIGPSQTYAASMAAPPGRANVAGPVRVFVRLRPPAERQTIEMFEISPERQGVVTIKDPLSSGRREHSFEFNMVFNEETSQDQLFMPVAGQAVDGALQGRSGCVIAYGQTGSGKTYSIFGEDDSPTERGLLPRAMERLLHGCAQKASRDGEELDGITVSFLEVYMDQVRDLGFGSSTEDQAAEETTPRRSSSGGLAKDDGGEPAVHKRPKLRRFATQGSIADRDQGGQNLLLRETPDGSIQVQGLAQLKVRDLSDVSRIVRAGLARRATALTESNVRSSRSHTVFTVQLPVTTADGVPTQLSFVDLAGSERLAKSKAEGQQFQEAMAINTSLTALGKVVLALASDPKVVRHVPYRDSKLTRILSTSLRTQVSVLATIHPRVEDYEESLNTLSFADRCKNVARQPQVKYVTASGTQKAKIADLQRQVADLKEKLREVHASRKAAKTDDVDDAIAQALAMAAAPSAGGMRTESMATDVSASGGGDGSRRAADNPQLNMLMKLQDQRKQQGQAIQKCHAKLEELSKKKQELLQSDPRDTEAPLQVPGTYGQLSGAMAAAAVDPLTGRLAQCLTGLSMMQFSYVLQLQFFSVERLTAQNDQRRAEELFDELDVKCLGIISESQVETLLTKLLRKKPPEDAMAYVWRELMKAQKSPSFSLRSLGLGAAGKSKEDQDQEAKRVNSGTTEAEESSAQASKPLLSQEGQAKEEIEEKQDADTETSFSRAAVLNVVTKDDVLWVLAQCDSSGNGRISRDEAIPAMAMWHALADRNFARQSQCCEVINLENRRNEMKLELTKLQEKMDEFVKETAKNFPEQLDRILNSSDLDDGNIIFKGHDALVQGQAIAPRIANALEDGQKDIEDQGKEGLQDLKKRQTEELKEAKDGLTAMLKTKCETNLKLVEEYEELRLAEEAGLKAAQDELDSLYSLVFRLVNLISDTEEGAYPVMRRGREPLQGIFEEATPSLIRRVCYRVHVTPPPPASA